MRVRHAALHVSQAVQHQTALLLQGHQLPRLGPGGSQERSLALHDLDSGVGVTEGHVGASKQRRGQPEDQTSTTATTCITHPHTQTCLWRSGAQEDEGVEDACVHGLC